ncbi:short-subunit dehydrogenase [Ochrobactrum sp. 19YEA23]|uniref:SDR family oxidoreductase n=1 Tax=Ochrobactrum sp. 19YEA23 TaxID=3039854 RepID=UPI002478DE8D|nr:short-subunit dehydrogenase [Ochrobactrum sp. 19YEA23]
MVEGKIFDGQRWLITGASSGIGLEVTKLLLQHGAKVAAIVRNPQKISALHQKYPKSLALLQLDLSEISKVAECVQSAISSIGRIDTVLSAAGYALVGAAEELGEHSIRKQINVNLVAPIFLAKAILPHFRERKTGRFLQLSSEGGQMAYPAASIYHASKWGLEGFFEALSMEVKSLGIAVTLIEPGRIQTEFDNSAIIVEPQSGDYRNSAVGAYFKLLAMGRFPTIGDPRKVAEAILDLGQQENPPLRLVLGSDSHKNIDSALRKRLSEVDQQKDISSRTDI